MLSLSHKRWLDDDVPHIADAQSRAAFVLEMRKRRNLMQASRNWHDHEAYHGGAAAVERIRRAMKKGERIAIFGDYDCDGVTSTAQMVRFFERHGHDVIVRLPHRVHDGYGFQVQHVAELAEQSVTLLITVDTGVASAEAIALASKAGMDTIVIDHHHFVTAPPCAALVHPQHSTLPAPYPSAAGVVFSFLHALETDFWKDRDIDLVLAGMGTVADVVELQSNNRALVQAALDAITRLPDGPLRQMIASVVDLARPIRSTDIAFRIAPRINAAGRMDDPLHALDALLKGGESIERLHAFNERRQEHGSRHMKDALAVLSIDDLPPLLSIVTDDIPHGIAGLIAGKLTEQFGRPSLVGHSDGTFCTASLRSTPRYHIAEGLARCGDLLLRYGGHAQAGGCTFEQSKLPELVERLSADILAHTKPEDLLPVLSIDASIDFRTVSPQFFYELNTLEPFGAGNLEPVFLVKNAMLEQVRLVGKESSHLQARIGHCKAVGFHLGRFADQLAGPVDLACRIGLNEWQGKREAQLFIEDIRVSKPVVVGERV